MNKLLEVFISTLDTETVSQERAAVLDPLIRYIQQKIDNQEEVRLNFICTHNSRRSHLSQIWAQTMAFYYGLPNVQCYSGGTEATAMFSEIKNTLISQGFQIDMLSDAKNPIYAIKYDENEPAIICFSKIYDDEFNPTSNFVAVMTCSSADENCPFIPGADKRITVKYEDPKVYDNTEFMTEKYGERSTQIAAEMAYVFKSIKI